MKQLPRPASPLRCWECGRNCPGGVCAGPHDFGRLEYNRAIVDGQIEGPRVPAITITGLTTVKLRDELSELEELRQRVRAGLKRAS